MILLLSVFYGVYLELMVHNLVTIMPTAAAAGGTTVTVRPLITSQNGRQVLAVLALFLVDWVCFLFIFPPSTDFALRLRDAWLFIPYLGVLSALGFAVVFALESPRRSCRPLGVYHGAALVAESAWIYFAFKALKDNIPGGEVAEMFMILFLYVLARLVLCVVNLVLPRSQWRVQPELLTVLALTLKPGLLVAVSKLPATRHILEVMR